MSALAAGRWGRSPGSATRAGAGARVRSLLRAQGWRSPVLSSAAPWPELSARRTESPARSPGSGALRPLGRLAIAARLGRRSCGRPSTSAASPSPPTSVVAAAATARRARRPPLPRLGALRAAPACAEPELRGQREPGTSAAEAETRRGGPSATPWPRLESSLRAGRGWRRRRRRRPRARPGSEPRGNTIRVRGRGRPASPRPSGGQQCQPRCVPGTEAHRSRSGLAFQPRPGTPLSKASSGSRLSLQGTPTPFPDLKWQRRRGGRFGEKGSRQPVDSSFPFPVQILRCLETLRGQSKTKERQRRLRK
jgi:hypothetical protein